VPELLQDAATPQALADALWRQLDDPAHCRNLRQRFTDMHHTLLRDTANASAQPVCALLDRQRARFAPGS